MCGKPEFSKCKFLSMMKQSILSALIMLCTYAASQSQNLVPNPSFEEYLECPFSTAELHNQVIGWYSWQETPDFFHECSNDLDGFAGVPDNAWGYQQPITGIAYAGIGTFAHTIPNIREYMAVQLTEPMVEGQNYYAVFYASMWGGGGDSHLWCATNHLGLRFFSNPTYDYQTNPLSPDNFAHLDYPNVLNDTTNWTKIEGWLYADQPYNWLAIGNFFTDENTDFEILNVNNSCFGIYYIENVCVGLSEEDCMYLLNSSQNEAEGKFRIYPNPANQIINIDGNQIAEKVEIFDAYGKLIKNFSLLNSENISIDISSLLSGIYILRIHRNNHFSNHKIIKQ